MWHPQLNSIYEGGSNAVAEFGSAPSPTMEHVLAAQ